MYVHANIKFLLDKIFVDNAQLAKKIIIVGCTVYSVLYATWSASCDVNEMAVYVQSNGTSWNEHFK